MNKILVPGIRSGLVEIHSSKSVVHRQLICAALGTQPTSIQIQGLSKDILATVDCLNALGAKIRASDAELSVKPIQSGSDTEEVMLPTGESGSTLRFMIPVVGALGRKAVFRMEGRLSERPLSPFDSVLQAHGMCIHHDTGCRNLLHCSGKLTSGEYSLPGNVSSQFFSGLLMALPLLDGASSLYSVGTLESAGYIRITENTLRASGIRLVDGKQGGWIIPGRQRPSFPIKTTAEGDWSNAAFFLCMGALSERGVTVAGLNPHSLQGDRAVMQILHEFGAQISASENDVTVRKGRTRPLTLDASSIPDLVPVLSVLACAAEGESTISGAKRLRLKESDRLFTTAELIRNLGGKIEEHPDGLTIYGTGKLRGGCIDAHNDHRIAMSAAVSACLCMENVTVQGAGCVEKSYPAFWETYETLQILESPAKIGERE